MLLGLRTVCYSVDDLDKAKAWYTDVVGHAPYFAEPYYVGFNVGGYELGLIPDTDGVGSYWGVDDVEAEVLRMVSLGAKLMNPTKDVGSGIKTATVVDPFGNAVGLIENPHFKLPS
jgi:predicted enzyme related to lactoylglutathione lyase